MVVVTTSTPLHPGRCASEETVQHNRFMNGMLSDGSEGNSASPSVASSDALEELCDLLNRTNRIAAHSDRLYEDLLESDEEWSQFHLVVADDGDDGEDGDGDDLGDTDNDDGTGWDNTSIPDSICVHSRRLRSRRQS